VSPSANAVVGVAGPGSTAAGFYTPVVLHPAGQPLQFVNADSDPHNFIATDAFGSDAQSWCKIGAGYPKGKCPIFWSATITVSEAVTPVLGVERVKAGQRVSFTCTLHGNMSGTLIGV